MMSELVVANLRQLERRVVIVPGLSRGGRPVGGVGARRPADDAGAGTRNSCRSPRFPCRSCRSSLWFPWSRLFRWLEEPVVPEEPVEPVAPVGPPVLGAVPVALAVDSPA